MPWARTTRRSSGDSFGGLFATYALLSEPDTFRRYGIGSPSLYWDDGAMFELEASYARDHTDLDARVFFSIGAYESSVGDARWRTQLPTDRRAEAEAKAIGEPPFDMVGDMERIVASLRGRAYPSLSLKSRRCCPGSTTRPLHHSISPVRSDSFLALHADGSGLGRCGRSGGEQRVDQYDPALLLVAPARAHDLGDAGFAHHK